MKKKRNWQFTLNQPEFYNQLSEYLKKCKTLKYLIACKEISPVTRHEHIHIFAHFKNLFKPNIKKCCGAHIEPCYGSIKQNIDYIKKLNGENDEIIEEYGEKPNDIEENLTIKKVKEMSNEEREELPLIYYDIIEKINSKDNNEIYIDEFYKKIQVFYIWGESEIGKTKLAFNIIKYIIEINDEISTFNNVKYENNFWIGAGDSKLALYDDFRDSHMKPSEFINFIDYSKHIMNIKYGSIQNNYEYIIITSIQNPKFLYLNDLNEENRQWLRRMKIINLINKNDLNKINIKELLKIN